MVIPQLKTPGLNVTTSYKHSSFVCHALSYMLLRRVGEYTSYATEIANRAY